jgi:hypothetical protein
MDKDEEVGEEEEEIEGLQQFLKEREREREVDIPLIRFGSAAIKDEGEGEEGGETTTGCAQVEQEVPQQAEDGPDDEAEAGTAMLEEVVDAAAKNADRPLYSVDVRRAARQVCVCADARSCFLRVCRARVLRVCLRVCVGVCVFSRSLTRAHTRLLLTPSHTTMSWAAKIFVW